MLRIGQFTDTFLPVVDGVGRVALSYAETLSRLGHQVTVVTPLNDTGFRGGLPYEIVDFQSFTVKSAPQYKTGVAPADQHYQRRMRMIDLDIIHAHSPFSTGFDAVAQARQRNIPLVSTFHSKYKDDFYKVTKSEALARLGVRIVVDFYEQCDEVWTVSEATAQTLREYGYKGPVTVMPNGVNLHTVSPESIKEAKAHFHLNGKPLLIFVGQMNWKKNILRILQAAALLKKQGQDFQLLLAGQGPDAKDIQKKAEELGLSDVTLFPGHITSNTLLDGLYASASLFLFPSIYDCAPMVVREAAVAGTASVLVRGSSAAQVVQNGVNGLLCEDDPVDLASVVGGALQDPARIKALGEKARETIPVPWETIMEEVVGRYRQLIETHKAHPRLTWSDLL